MRKAIRSLPWYLLGSYLIVPLVCAPFTWGASLIWYFAPVAGVTGFVGKYGTWQDLAAASFPAVIGIPFWAVRQFVRAARYSHVKISRVS